MYESDIPIGIAIRAHYGTSHVPDERGRAEVKDYANTLEGDWSRLSAVAERCGTKHLLPAEFERYRAGYKNRMIACLSARSQIMSTMITGSSNFPTRRNQKKCATYERRTSELIEFRRKALRAIHKKLDPQSNGIRSDDSDAVQLLREKIESLEQSQKLMVETNARIRRHRNSTLDVRIRALEQLGHLKPIAESLLTPDCMGDIGYPGYKLTNNSNNIRRLKARLVTVSDRKQAQAWEEKRAHAMIEFDPPGNRIRVFFHQRPNDTSAMAAIMRSHGFRWSPKQGAWSAYFNRRSAECARKQAGQAIEEGAGKAPI